MDEQEFINIAPSLRQTALKAAKSTGADDDEADDMAQETMIRLWQLRDRLQNLRSIESFTATVARHLTINSFRKQRTVQGDSFFRTIADTTSTDDGMTIRDDEKWLEATLRKLPSTEYAILQMRQVEHMDSTEIAERLGIAETSVRTLLSRARRRLLEEIRKRR